MRPTDCTHGIGLPRCGRDCGGRDRPRRKAHRPQVDSQVESRCAEDLVNLDLVIPKKGPKKAVSDPKDAWTPRLLDIQVEGMVFVKNASIYIQYYPIP